MTTNLSFSEWTQLFENATMVAALADRFPYRSYVLDMSGPSFRLMTAQAENDAVTTACNTTGSNFTDIYTSSVPFSLDNLKLDGDVLNIPLFMADQTERLIRVALADKAVDK